MKPMVPSKMPHICYRITEWNDGYNFQDAREPVDATMADVVSSELADESGLPSGLHAPLLDLDLPAALIESSTPGHYHLYVDTATTWFRYRVFLWAAWKAGVIERGYYKAAVARRGSHLRTPGLPKIRRDEKFLPGAIVDIY